MTFTGRKYKGEEVLASFCHELTVYVVLNYRVVFCLVPPVKFLVCTTKGWKLKLNCGYKVLLQSTIKATKSTSIFYENGL